MTDQPRPPVSSGWIVTLAVCGVIGVVTVAATLFLMRAGSARMGGVEPSATEEYGRRLILQTSFLLGPDHPDPATRYTGSRLNCGSCHLDAGTQPGTLALTGAFQRYPRFSGRDGKEADLKDRINGCMERSMNGRKLPRDSVEIEAMVAYLRSISEQYAAMGATRRELREPSAWRRPDRAASPEAGGAVYEERCALCHGRNGEGLPASTDPRRGYVFPPLWGDDSFNNGAGMGRVLTAARFIKARMPYGLPALSDDEAFDVAAYVNSKPRPQKANLEQDYPDLTTKPVDAPYGPYADPFPADQHRFGPFGPIEAFYKKK